MPDGFPFSQQKCSPCSVILFPLVQQRPGEKVGKTGQDCADNAAPSRSIHGKTPYPLCARAGFLELETSPSQSGAVVEKPDLGPRRMPPRQLPRCMHATHLVEMGFCRSSDPEPTAPIYTMYTCTANLRSTTEVRSREGLPSLAHSVLLRSHRVWQRGPPSSIRCPASTSRQPALQDCSMLQARCSAWGLKAGGSAWGSGTGNIGRMVEIGTGSKWRYLPYGVQYRGDGRSLHVRSSTTDHLTYLYAR